jgi:hypothetical protein
MCLGSFLWLLSFELPNPASGVGVPEETTVP